MKKWILPIIILLVAIIITASVLEITGIIHIRGLLWNSLAASRAFGPLIRTYQLGVQNSEELANRHQALEELQRNLAHEADLLRSERANLERRKKELEREERRIQELIQAWDERQAQDQEAKKKQERLERTQEMYAHMRAEDAASILIQMDDELVKTILEGIPPEQLAAIFAALEPKQAARLSALLTN
ncbi:MAG: MotE family protein [Limnochordia bacterium]|jgi:flagellar motility protein MotE (MotC chaperone)|nr:hypothetical protein [Bacillota bacterium]